MSKNKLFLMLSLIAILLITSGFVYNDQQQKFIAQSEKTSKNYSKNYNKTDIINNTNENTAKLSSDYLYISYKVKPGDHLYSLARKYMPTYQLLGVVKNIKTINNLKNDTLYENQIITIPIQKNIVK